MTPPLLRRSRIGYGAAMQAGSIGIGKNAGRDSCVAGLPLRRGWPLWPTALAALLLAGCASSPPPLDNQASRAPPTGTATRDGAPADPPPDLASLPDPEPRVEPIRSGGPNKPYVVLGQAYEPMSGDVAWKETGMASWYGTKFHGRRTASGELYSMYGLTAAHRTLPIPSYARVRNVKNGKTIIVRVNDRGPFHSSRVMDLSYAAALKLGILSAGQAKVEIERLTFDDIRTGAWRQRDESGAADTAVAEASPAVAPPAAGLPDPILLAAAQGAQEPSETRSDAGPSSGGGAVSGVGAAATAPMAPPERAFTTQAKGFWVQLAALGRREGVDQLQQRIATELTALQPLTAVFHEARLYKLQVGPYPSRAEAQAAAREAGSVLQLAPMVLERR